MLALAPSPTPKQYSRTYQQYHQWEEYYSEAYQLYQHRKFEKAAEYFSRSLQISKQLKDVLFFEPAKKNGIEMLFSSSHNLSACLNVQNLGILAKGVLQEVHEHLLEISTNQSKLRELRLEALAYLDKSLFSLSSQLSYINQVDDIHSLILRTENIAATASQELLDPKRYY